MLIYANLPILSIRRRHLRIGEGFDKAGYFVVGAGAVAIGEKKRRLAVRAESGFGQFVSDPASDLLRRALFMENEIIDEAGAKSELRDNPDRYAKAPGNFVPVVNRHGVAAVVSGCEASTYGPSQQNSSCMMIHRIYEVYWFHSSPLVASEQKRKALTHH